MSEPSPTTLDRFRGCLIGQAVGDALGAPFETMPAEAIYYQFGSTEKIIESPPFERLEYTDDTQMMIAVAEVLAEFGEIDPDALMDRFAAYYDPARAYGPGTSRILETARRGGDWRALSTTILPGGSYGNGAAMRAAPIGLMFPADSKQVLEQAERSALPTHAHAAGVDGARLLALGVSIAMRPGPLRPREFFEHLLVAARSSEFQTALVKALQLRKGEPIGVLGNSIEAHRSVPTALACFARHPDSYVDAVSHALSLGGDVDTLCAMVGALSGARLGIQGVPAHLIDRLEDGVRGRSHLESLANRLFERWTEHPR